jgi:NodT family efflux transporter outer membrane factor (OMF) lipoprotein
VRLHTRLHTGRSLRAMAGLMLIVCGASACAVGPKYIRPAAPTPTAYKENKDFHSTALEDARRGPPWKRAQPADDRLRGDWWQLFDDPQLTALEEQLDRSNQNLKAAIARFAEARALVGVARSARFPLVTASAQGMDTRLSLNRPQSSATSRSRYTDYLLAGDVSYEADVWGRVRRTIEGASATAQASAADLETVRLSLHAELALDYFSLRGLDVQKRLLDSAVDAYRQALDLTTNRFKGGVASEVDVAQAQTQLDTTRAQALDLETARAQFEHAIAVLIGQPPSSFTLPPVSAELAAPPSVPGSLPSDLLERRPDIAAAERRMAAANAQIGVAVSSYFPLLTLGGSGGFESTAFGALLTGASGFWAAVPSAVVTVFDAGRRHAVTEQARATYTEMVASYQQTVLSSFAEVEDSLAAIRVLEQEASVQKSAVQAAQRSLTLSTNRYQGGVTTYLEVLTAQTAALADERTSVDISTRRLLSTVALIKAVGGRWDRLNLPTT